MLKQYWDNPSKKRHVLTKRYETFLFSFYIGVHGWPFLLPIVRSNLSHRTFYSRTHSKGLIRRNVKGLPGQPIKKETCFD